MGGSSTGGGQPCCEGAAVAHQRSLSSLLGSQLASTHWPPPDAELYKSGSSALKLGVESGPQMTPE